MGYVGEAVKQQLRLDFKQRHTSCACLGCVFVWQGCDGAVRQRQSCHPGFSPVLVCQLSPADKH